MKKTTLIFLIIILISCNKNEEPQVIIKLPDPVVLNPISEQNGELSLSWSAFNESEFKYYQILRSEKIEGPFKTIKYLSDIFLTNYIDNTVEFGQIYFYQINTILTTADELLSNMESGAYTVDNVNVGIIERFRIDPIRPYIYALDKNVGTLKFINKQTLTYERAISVGDQPTDMDFSFDNSKLYIALSGTNKIAVVNLNTQEKITDIIIDVTQPSLGRFETPNRIVCLANETLVVADNDQHNKIISINANNGDILVSSYSFYELSLISSFNKTSIIVSESQTTSVQAFRYNLESNGQLSQTPVDNTIAVNWSHNHGTLFTPISGNGEFIFYCGRKFAFNNLRESLASFSEQIHASNSDGTIAVGSNYIWDATSYGVIKTLPFVNSGKMVYDTDSEAVYIYDDVSTLYYFKTN